VQATSQKSTAQGSLTIMKQFRRRTARTILVPFALFAIVLAGALPASAAPLTSASADYAYYIDIGPLSLSW
jgi:hypothetical protein